MLLFNVIFLVLVLRLSFEKKIIETLLKKEWPLLLLGQHILFWLTFVIVNSYFYFSFVPFPNSIYLILIVMLCNGTMYYLGFNKLVPEFYITKNYSQYILYTILLFVVASLIRILIEPEITGAQRKWIDNGMLFVFIYVTNGISILVSSLLGIAKNKFVIEHNLSVLRKDKEETDLNLLKSKINPHFLLNTLNNIYAAADNIEEPQSKSILDLSLLLQYTIYETAYQRISISKELQMIEALTGLYQLKHGGHLKISMNFENMDWMDEIEIPPTALLTLYENALKHSAVGNDPDARIDIHIKFEKNMHFVVKNNISTLEASSLYEGYKGVGLKLMKQLMDIEIGTHNYTLTTEKKDNEFSAELILIL